MKNSRYVLLDMLRGIALISMIVYHAMWDVVYIFGVEADWYVNDGFWWQRLTCWTFIILSGFCMPFGNDKHKKVRRGLLILGLSVVISIVTGIFMPDGIILFGVLSLIGSAMILMVILDSVYNVINDKIMDKLSIKINPILGLIINMLLYIIMKDINIGTIGIGELWSWNVPESWYSNMFTAYLGFPDNEFFSSDYFPIFPWFFLYQAGYFLHYTLKKFELIEKIPSVKDNLFAWMGRHSLMIYILHQPVVYGVLMVVFAV